MPSQIRSAQAATGPGTGYVYSGGRTYGGDNRNRLEEERHLYSLENIPVVRNAARGLHVSSAFGQTPTYPDMNRMKTYLGRMPERVGEQDDSYYDDIPKMDRYKTDTGEDIKESPPQEPTSPNYKYQPPMGSVRA